MILNLPATVERRPPTHYADLIERFIRRFPYRDRVRISLHGHNDQGMVVASTEMALMAGADRVEGTLFGHGERTGNLDIVTMALNFHARGLSTGLNFSDLPRIAETVERLTGLPVYYRQPYSGELVFTAFSGSHQDAINKVLHRRRQVAEEFGQGWKVPYLHIDPADVGRRFERLIRITSQSGKGGIAWVLEHDHGIALPKAMQAEVGAVIKAYCDRVHREVDSEEVRRLFEEHFVRPRGPFQLLGYWPRPDEKDPAHIHGEARVLVNGVERLLSGDGNGPVSAFVYCLQGLLDEQFTVEGYHEQAIGKGAEAQAVAYVPLRFADGAVVFGVGIDTNIDQAAVQAIMAGLNRAATLRRKGKPPTPMGQANQ
jgi:2-isopropylmalate synthase